MTNSALRAFKLEGDLALEDLNGATTSFGADAQTLDVKAALEEGNGTIVADHPDVISALRGVAILEEVDVPEDTEPTPLSVSFAAEASAVPVGVVPQGAPPEQIGVDPHATGPAPEVAAVHADEPDSVQGAAQQPPSQASPPSGDASGKDEASDPPESARPARFK